jgi:hypothetical protein
MQEDFLIIWPAYYYILTVVAVVKTTRGKNIQARLIDLEFSLKLEN